MVPDPIVGAVPGAVWLRILDPIRPENPASLAVAYGACPYVEKENR